MANKANGASTNEKRAWARQWMKDQAKVTIATVNDAVKKHFGFGFGKRVVTDLVREHKGGTRPRQASEHRSTGQDHGVRNSINGISGLQYLQRTSPSMLWMALLQLTGVLKRLGVVELRMKDGTKLPIE